jgi:hypothetical protein
VVNNKGDDKMGLHCGGNCGGEITVREDWIDVKEGKAKVHTNEFVLYCILCGKEYGRQREMPNGWSLA